MNSGHRSGNEHCHDLIVALSIKLKIFGLSILEPANCYCDSSRIVKNMSIPELTLWESTVEGEIRVAKEGILTNLVSRKQEHLRQLL